MSEEAWGHKLTFSVYVKGHSDYDPDAVGRILDCFDDALGDVDFVGCRYELIEQEPRDQVAT